MSDMADTGVLLLRRLGPLHKMWVALRGELEGMTSAIFFSLTTLL